MSKYDEERKRILSGMKSKNVSFGASSDSKVKSKYDDERELLKNPVSKESTNEPQTESQQKQEAFNKTIYGGTDKLKQPTKKYEIGTMNRSPQLKTPVSAITKVKDQKNQLGKMGVNSTISSNKVLTERATKETAAKYGMTVKELADVRSANEAKHKPQFEKIARMDAQAEKARNIPVIGEGLHRLDNMAANTKGFSDIAQSLYTPSAGLSMINMATKGVGAAISRVAPKIGNGSGLLPRMTTRAIEEAATGVPLSVGNTLARNPEASNRELGISALAGGVGGAVLGGAGPVVGDAIGMGVNKLRNRGTSLPEAQPNQPIGQTQRAAQEPISPNPVNDVASTPEPFESTSPVKVNWWNQLFGDQNLGITPFGSNQSDRIVTTEQQIVRNPLTSGVKGLVDSTKQTAKSGYQNTVDFLSPLKTINRETYDTAMDASRANNLSNTIIRDKFVDLEGNVIGNSLNDIMKQTRGLGKKFDDYLVLRHAETRMLRGERVYDENLAMTPEKAKQAVETMEARYPGLKQLGDDWDNFNGNMLDSGVREGLISQAARDSMRESNPHYAAMRRQFTLGEKMSRPKWGGGGSSFSGQNAPIKSVSPTGSTRKIVSPLRSAIEQTYAWKNAELRNRTMQGIAKAIQLDPDGMKGIAEIIKKPSTSYRSLDDALREGGSDEFLELLDNDFKSLFKKAASGEENIVRAMINGNPVYIKVHNPEAVKALLGLGNEQAGIVLQAAQMLSNATKRGATGLLAPMFAVKSFTADTIQAAIQSPNAFKHLAVDLPHALVSSIGDIFKIPGLKNLAEDFRRSGGEYSSLLRGDRKLNTTIGSLRRDPFLSGRGIAKGAWTTAKAPFKAMEKVADTSENMNRMAAFSRAMKGKERTPENVRKAINAARESTVNFSRKGAWTRETEAFIPYTNAAVQGMYRMAKAFYKNPVKTIAALSTLVVMPKLYEYAKFNNDPDYQQLPARERYRNIIISKNKDGTFNKQFIEPSYLAFGALFTDILNDIVNNDPEAYKGTMDAIVNAWAPPAVSGALKGITQGGGIETSLKGLANATVAAPAQAIMGNQSFTGAPIVPQRLQSNSAEFQYDERTSSAAKEIGKRIGLAPLKVDYLLRAYGGDPARLLLPLTSDAGSGTPRNTLLKNFIVDPVFTNNLSNDFYIAKDKFTKAKNDFEDHGKALPAWYSESAYKLVNGQAIGSASKKISGLTSEKRTVQGNTLLSAKSKADKLRDIQREINEIYTDVNSQLQSGGFKFPSR